MAEAGNWREEKRALADLNRVFADLVSQLQTVRPIEAEQLASQVARLREQIVDQGRDMDDRFHQQQNELNGVTVERARLAATIQEREATIRTKDVKIGTLEQQLRLARQQADELHLRVSDASARAEAADGKLNAERLVNAELQRTIAKLEDEIRIAHESVSAEVTLRVRAENELVSLKEDLDKQNKHFEAQIKAYEADIERLGALIANANSDLNGQVHQQLRIALEAAQASYVAEAESLKKKYIRLYEEYVASEDERLARRGAALQDEITFLKSKLDGKDREVAKLTERVQALLVELSSITRPRGEPELVEDIKAEITTYHTWVDQLRALISGVGQDGFLSPVRHNKRARVSIESSAWETVAHSEAAVFTGIDINGANVEIVNRSSAPINLERWSLVVQTPSGDKKTLVFRSFNMSPGEKIRVAAGTNAGNVQFSVLDSFNLPSGALLQLVDPSGNVAAEARRVSANLLSPGSRAGAHLDN